VVHILTGLLYKPQKSSTHLLKVSYIIWIILAINFIHLPCFVYMQCNLTGFSPSVYNTISSLQKRVPDHPTDFKAGLSKKKLQHIFCVNESRTQTAVWLYLILCQVQTVRYDIYMHNALNLILCQVQTLCYNIYMDNALYLILCQVQTVRYNIYMDNALYLIPCEIQTVRYNIYMDNALYLILWQVQSIRYNICFYNALYLILCQVQTVRYNIHMDDVWSECNWTVSLQKKINQQNYAKLCNACYSDLDVEHLENHLVNSLKVQIKSTNTQFH